MSRVHTKRELPILPERPSLLDRDRGGVSRKDQEFEDRFIDFVSRFGTEAVRNMLNAAKATPDRDGLMLRK